MALEAETVITHSADDIIAAYTSKEFHEHLAGKVGSQLKSFDSSARPDGGYTIVSEQAINAEKLPDIAQKVLKGTVTVTVTDTWSGPDADGSRRSDTEVKIHGAPVKAVASQTLHARGAAETKATVRGDVDVKIPLIGGKIKKAAEPYMKKFVELQSKEVAKFIEQNKA
ncbi:DUF2505 domain-containing protein [Nesterenkonia flava]|uniref:DUF2505 domain-containing protein n=1 Tax=Nesterenkonia flava TaxID=469799 RepID=A0ABU1FR29_9MICC|nr:DUF2505 domain-containing protein [Nesterenkonia flava]MDR5710722.1 DUF2505 domain-containing protein [Nesterenkonia flava]